MTMFFIIAGGLLVLIIFIGYYLKVTSGYKSLIRKLTAENHKIAQDYEKFDTEMATLTQLESDLSRELSSLGGANLGNFDDSGSMAGMGSSTTSTLLEKGLLSSEDIKKAKIYQQKSSVPCTLEDALVLLGIVSQADIDSAC